MYNINNNQEVEPGALGPPKPENGFLHFFIQVCDSTNVFLFLDGLFLNLGD